MLDRDQVRLAAAVAHAVIGSELRLRCTAGDVLVVSRHPAADLSPGAFRQLVAATTGAGAPIGHGVSLRVDEMDVGGSIGRVGGGVLRSRTPSGHEVRWVASTLEWNSVRRLVDAFGEEHEVTDALEATVAPDELLGVTLVRLTATTGPAAVEIDRVAAALSGSLLVEELLTGLRAPLDAGSADGDR